MKAKKVNYRKCKLLADVLVGSLPSEIESQMDSDKPYQWINDNIFSQLSKIDDAQLLSEFQNKIQKLLSFEDGDIDVVTYGEVNHFKKSKKWKNAYFNIWIEIMV